MNLQFISPTVTHNLNVQQLDSVLVSFPISSDDANKKVDTDFNQSSNGNNNMPDLDTVKVIRNSC